MDMTDQHAPDEPATEEIDNADLPETASPRDAEPAELAATVEAILFASDTPLPVSRIAAVAEMTPGQIKTAVETLNEQYSQAASAFRIETIANGYQMLTLPEYHDVLKRLLNVKKETKLTQPALEALAIVAYRQPVLRADIEAVRGVACGEVLRGLMERGLVKIVGRADVIGRPMLYGTTRRFLEIFGLKDLKELPRIEELRELAASREKAQVAAAPEAAPDDSKKPDEEPPADDNVVDETEEELDEEFDEEEEEEFDEEDDEDDDFDGDDEEEDDENP